MVSRFLAEQLKAIISFLVFKSFRYRRVILLYLINIDAAESVLLENTLKDSLIFKRIYAKTITGKGDGRDISLTTAPQN